MSEPIQAPKWLRAMSWIGFGVFTASVIATWVFAVYVWHLVGLMR